MSCYGEQQFCVNIAALQQRQPDVAALIGQTRIPSTVQAATGRDGSSTFLLRDEAGVGRWFGQSSMPSVSAAELFHAFASDGGNVVLPGILTGAEPLALLEKLPVFAAVMIVEPDLLSFRLAFHLHDYSTTIEAGRMVLLPETELAAAMERLFAAHPGYELPHQVMSVPHRSASDLSRLNRELVQAGTRAAAVQAIAIKKAASTIGQRSFDAPPATPNVAVISNDPSPQAADLANRLECDLRDLGWPYVVCLPSRPDQCHFAARLRAIEQLRADVVLSVNGVPTQLMGQLPGWLRVVCWYAAGAMVGSLDRDLARRVVFCVSDKKQSAALLEADVAPDCILDGDSAAEVPAARLRLIANRVGCCPA